MGYIDDLIRQAQQQRPPAAAGRVTNPTGPSGYGTQFSQNPIAGQQYFSGRQLNPTNEIGRLLDELELNRQNLANLSFQPSDQDIALQQQIQRATLGEALAQTSGGFGSRGLSGSSLEAVQRATMAGQIGLQSQQLINQQAQQAAFQRGQLELGRNRQLFESLIQSVTPTLTPGAPGVKIEEKKRGGIGGAIGGILGGIAGSALGPIGTAIGGRLGGAIGGAFGGGRNIYANPYDYQTAYMPMEDRPLGQFGGNYGSRYGG